jgi:hypothetical protein
MLTNLTSHLTWVLNNNEKSYLILFIQFKKSKGNFVMFLSEVSSVNFCKVGGSIILKFEDNAIWYWQVSQWYLRKFFQNKN